ncbi:MAG: carboxypeptidase regulatory-like domain-containing protein [Armatimonadetes bacterium]|nr:carboxypeptidase regulatory-like domain-containing protein [Armatimonadota bacterium]
MAAQTTTTGTGGSYSFANLPIGSYQVKAEMTGYTPNQYGVTVQSGQQTIQDIPLVPIIPDQRTWDLAADWSDAVNPNPSVDTPNWTYATPADDWQTPNPLYDRRVVVDGSGFDFGPGQYGWTGGTHGWWDGLYKSVGVSVHDFPAGKVGGHGVTGFIWTSPRSAVINIAGSVWKMRDASGTILTIGSNIGWISSVIASGVVPTNASGFTSSNPYTLDQMALDTGSTIAIWRNIAVNQGDTIAFRWNADFLGVNLTITEDPIPTPDPGTVSGVVRDAYTGNPLVGAEVTLSANGVSPSSTTTGADGSYSFADVMSGAYTVRAEKADYIAAQTDTQVQSGQQLNIDIDLFPVPPPGDNWDLALDWSDVDNPNPSAGTPTWIYGLVDETFTSITPWTSRTQLDGTGGDFGPGQEGWYSGTYWWESLFKSVGVSAHDCPAGKVGGGYGAGLMWTAPKALTGATISGSFWKLRDGGQPASVSFAVDGVTYLNYFGVPSRASGTNSGNPYSLSAALTQEGLDPGAILSNVSIAQGSKIAFTINDDYIGVDLSIRTEPAPNGNVKVEVVDIHTGVPISGADVQLTGASTLVGQTGADGTYTFRNVTPGNYSLEASRADYIAKTAQVTALSLTTATKTISLLKDEITPIGDAKNQAAGWICKIQGIASAVLPDYDCLYLEERDRSAGIRVLPLAGHAVAQGDEVVVIGTIQAGGYMLPSQVLVLSRDNNLKPVGMNNRSVGPANADLLVSTWGSVVEAPGATINGEKVFYITDGTAVPGGSTVTIPVMSSIVFEDDFSDLSMKPDWLIWSGSPVQSDGVLRSGSAWARLGVVTHSLTDAVVRVDAQAGMTQFAFLLRTDDGLNTLVLPFFSQITMGFHETLNGAWSPQMGNTNVADMVGNVHFIVSLVGSDIVATAFDNYGHVHTTSIGLTRVFSAGYVGLWHDTSGNPVDWDDFVVGAPGSVTVPADCIQVIVPHNVTGIPTLQSGDYVSVTGIAARPTIGGGALKTIVVRDGGEVIFR